MALDSQVIQIQYMCFLVFLQLREDKRWYVLWRCLKHGFGSTWYRRTVLRLTGRSLRVSAGILDGLRGVS